MGVHGLTPFLRKTWYAFKTCVYLLNSQTDSPAVLKQLPERFGSLTGKRLAMWAVLPFLAEFQTGSTF